MTTDYGYSGTDAYAEAAKLAINAADAAGYLGRLLAAEGLTLTGPKILSILDGFVQHVLDCNEGILPEETLPATRVRLFEAIAAGYLGTLHLV